MKTYPWKKLHNTQMFVEELFKIAKVGNNPSVHQQTTNKEECYIHTTHYLTIKRNEVIIYATTLMDLENIM